MEIIIERKDLAYLVPQEKFVWRNHISSKIGLNVTLAIPAILFLLDALDRYSTTKNLTGASFTISLGIIIFILMNVISLFYNRYKTIKYTGAICKKGSKHHEPSTITITDWGVRTKALTYNFEFSWSYFQGYKVKGNFLLIRPIHYSFPAVAIEKSEIESGEYANLISFLNGKFPSSKKNGT
jgi:hypothetical protein